MASSNLTRFLTTPSKVANALEWQKLSSSLLALNIGRDEIGLTLASHPSRREQTTLMLNPIPLKFVHKGNRKFLDSTFIAQLNNVVQSKNVCGFVVNWPLQKEGRIGASCGRVLHTLDSLCLDAKTPILSNNRKFCLWNGLHVPLEQDDLFGRCSTYSRPSTNEPDFVHFASREQYNQNRVVGDIWSDFCRAHWPEIYDQEHSSTKDAFSFDSAWLDDLSDSYRHACAL
jgi:RNase H-fold protein (predicted Holliday junction resolvase)